MVSGSSGLQEVVVLFDPVGTTVTAELPIAVFGQLLRHQTALPERAASVVRAAYAMVGAGLAVRGVAFFLFKTNAQGQVDPAFNLPLEYMVRNAGEGPDLGMGPIRLACRSQCPVPWHAVNLWEPLGEGEQHSAHQVQRAVWRNRVGLKPLPTRSAHTAIETLQPRQQARVLPTGASGECIALDGATPAQARSAPAEPALRYARRSSEPRKALRDQLHEQQRSYLDQIRACRDEIQKLKAALRHEKDRNRRLEALLRGSV